MSESNVVAVPVGPVHSITLPERAEFVGEIIPVNDFEYRICQLLKYGAPRLMYISNGWFCAVDMNTSVTGTAFQVKSEFGCDTPITALRQCEQRIKETLKRKSEF